MCSSNGDSEYNLSSSLGSWDSEIEVSENNELRLYQEISIDYIMGIDPNSLFMDGPNVELSPDKNDSHDDMMPIIM